MGKTVVVYRSKTGYTRTYAEWIAEELGCTLLENKKLGLEDIEGYDTIIYGGGMHASSISGISLINKNYEALKDKNLVVWVTGCCPGRDYEMAAVWKKNFTDGQLRKVKTFYLRGGFDFDKLSKGNKLVMGLLRSRLAMKKNPTDDDTGMLNAFTVPEDHRDKKNIEKLVECVRSFG